MAQDIKLEFSVMGGSDPAANEFIRIEYNGLATCLVGNSSPMGQPQDEIGLYQATLSESVLETFKKFITDNNITEINEEYGAMQPDAGFYFLHLIFNGCDKRIKWSPFAEIPNSLKEFQYNLRKLIQYTRQFPVQCVKASLNLIPDKIKTNQTFQVVLHFVNQSNKPIRIFLRNEITAEKMDFRLYYHHKDEHIDNYGSTIMDYYYSGYLVSSRDIIDEDTFLEPLKLNCGEDIKFDIQAPFVFTEAGSYNLYSFLQLNMEVIFDCKPQVIDSCFIITEPLPVVVVE